jgi:GT2 family glycosyltransferase
MQKITFTTNVGKNTLKYLKLLLQSLKMNLDSQEHEILIFVDADNEGTLEYLLGIQKDFTDLRIIKNTVDIPIGYARNKTILTEYAKHDIISYLQSDMVIGPHYDTEILKHVKLGRILSSTRIEPPLHGESAVTITKNFGLHPEEFDFNAWNTFSNSVKRDELTHYFFAPLTYYKEDWLRLGGYDTTFRRSREDSDFVQRCLHADIELIQTFSANVYHFTCVSSRGKDWFNARNVVAQSRVQLQQQADQIELTRFIRKWGNFNHGEKKLFKLDMDLVVKNYTLHQVRSLEPFFSRVWVETETDKLSLLSEYSNLHFAANTLFDISDETWNLHRALYKLEDFDYTIRVGCPADYSIKVIIDFNLVSNQNQFIQNIHQLYDILVDSDIGEYELDGVPVFINKVTTLPTELHANNPSFDYALLTIY